MKKILTSSVFRSVCSIIIGALLVKYPDNTVTGITVLIGVLFLLPGIISILTYLNSRRHPEQVFDVNGNQIAGSGSQSFPIVGIGSVILGLVLALMPSTFVAYLMYVLGFLLILGAANQFLSLINMSKVARISFVFYVVPSLLFLTGLFVLVHPMESASIPLLIIGISLIIYGITEITNVIKFYRMHKSLQHTGESVSSPSGEA